MSGGRTCRRGGEKKPFADFANTKTCTACVRFCPICIACDCDPHRVPPVCVCDTPNLDSLGACRNPGCNKAFLPHQPGFASVRSAWRRHLGLSRQAVAS